MYSVQSIHKYRGLFPFLLLVRHRSFNPIWFFFYLFIYLFIYLSPVLFFTSRASTVIENDLPLFLLSCMMVSYCGEIGGLVNFYVG